LYLNDLLVELITTSGATIKVKNDANCYLANSTTSVTFTMVNQTLTNIIDIFPQSYLGSNILVGVL
jgi:hypothetical protein